MENSKAIIFAPGVNIGVTYIRNPSKGGAFSIIIDVDPGETEYLRDWGGNLILDLKGDPIPFNGPIKTKNF